MPNHFELQLTYNLLNTLAMPKHYAYQVQQNNHPLPSTSSSTIKSPLPDIDGQNEQNDHILDRRVPIKHFKLFLICWLRNRKIKIIKND